MHKWNWYQIREDDTWKKWRYSFWLHMMFTFSNKNSIATIYHNQTSENYMLNSLFRTVDKRGIIHLYTLININLILEFICQPNRYYFRNGIEWYKIMVDNSFNPKLCWIHIALKKLGIRKSFGKSIIIYFIFLISLYIRKFGLIIF